MKADIVAFLLAVYVISTNSLSSGRLKDDVVSILRQPINKFKNIINDGMNQLFNGKGERFESYNVVPVDSNNRVRIRHPGFPNKDNDVREDLQQPNDDVKLWHGEESSSNEAVATKETNTLNKELSINISPKNKYYNKIYPIQNDNHKKENSNYDEKSLLENAIHYLAVMGKDLRRYRPHEEDSEDTTSESSGDDLEEFKKEWQKTWLEKKVEALNTTVPRGDTINMVAARPWGMPCGDPAQHDVPWGTCMLAAECTAEFRIYRGDFYCGRTMYICCAMGITDYNLNQGLDLSFNDRSFPTDSEERRKEAKGKSHDNKKKKNKEKQKRQEERKKRRKKIKRKADEIQKAIKAILHAVEKNGTRERKKKTRMLKRFLKNLKKRYQDDKISVQALHQEMMINVDDDLIRKLLQIKALNNEFMSNSTFRDIVINGTISVKGLRMLSERFPELRTFLPKLRRDLINDNGPKPLPNDDEIPKYFEYDIEYGLLHF